MQAAHSLTLRALFDVCSGLSPAERSAYLDANAVDAALRGRLERLLRADTRNDDLFEGGAPAAARAIGPVETPAPAPGSRIGPFEIVDTLGEGGSSTVFRAQRDSEGVRQVVALKMLHRALYSIDARRQFLRERVALAQLTHPGIARLIEGGVSEQGIAYIALELVEGLPITEHARTHRLGLDERLALFAQVCRAVEAAHRALIVHRDLKPSNVFVAGDGSVKLLDFGIAKLLHVDDVEHTCMPMLTPAYAAPEQHTNGLITTATDVYALGVLLGELLTGHRRSSDDSRAPSAQIQARDDGSLPGTPQQTRRALRGDLDNIILKATAAAPDRRYASAGAFADDIDRLRDGKPVRAHPPSRWYRARKFLRRHRIGVAFGAVLATTVLAALAISLWQARETRQEQRRADAMRDFMVGAFVEAEPGAPREGPPRITDVAEKAIVRARNDAGMDERVRVELLDELGAMLRHQGRLQSARDTLQWNYDRARAAFGDDAPLTISAGYELGQSLIAAGELDAARAVNDRLLAQASPDNDQRRDLLLLSSMLATRSHDRTRSVADARAAIALAREDKGTPHLAEALSYLSAAQLDAGDVRGAIATSEQQLALRQAQYGAKHISVATAHATLSRAYRRAGNLEAAQQHILAALDIDKAVLPTDDWRVSRHLNALVVLRAEQRDFTAALDAAREALRIDRIAYGEEHARVFDDLATIGSVALKAEDYAQALPPLSEWIRHASDSSGKTSADAAGTRIDYAIALAHNGQREAGIEELWRAIAMFESASDSTAGERAGVFLKLAALRLDFDAPADALAAIDKADANLATASSAERAVLSEQAATLRARACLQAGRPADARAALDQASTHALVDPVARAEAPLLSAQATLQLHDVDAATHFSALGHASLATLRHPPARLVLLASSLQRDLDAFAPQ